MQHATTSTEATKAVNSLPALYNAHFDVVRVRSEQLLDAVYRLRYQVYCVENAFENPDEHLDGRESDALDDRSVHAALIHRSTERVVGTVRIVLPDPELGLDSLPITALADPEVQRQLSGYAQHGIAEVSRFALTKMFRQGLPASLPSVGFDGAEVNAPGRQMTAAEERRIMPYLILGLVRAAIALCREQRVAYMAAVMEPTLLRLLTRFGICFTTLGPLVEYHGLRQPCIIDVDAMERGIADKSEDFGETVRGPMKPELVAAE